MSWFKSAVSKAVEVGNKNNITRTVKNYADTVVHQAGQAVAEGAKILQDRIAARNFKSFKQTVKRLEEASVSCRGPERVQLMRRWLTVLKETEKSSGDSFEEKEKNNEHPNPSDEPKGSPRKASLVLYFDPDVGGEPMTFRDVFLYSQALEGITICMILEAPNEEEISLLLELYRLCLAGGKEVHNAIVSSIQDLAKVFANYQDEVLVNISLAAAQARLHNTREERDQFYEANDQIVTHLKSKEEELSKSIGSCRVEGDVLGTWINFLEDTWALQCSYVDTKEKEIKDELERHESYFVNLVIQLLSSYELGYSSLQSVCFLTTEVIPQSMSCCCRGRKGCGWGRRRFVLIFLHCLLKELRPTIDRIGSAVASDDFDYSGLVNPKKNLEEYMGYEAKDLFTISSFKT